MNTTCLNAQHYRMDITYNKLSIANIVKHLLHVCPSPACVEGTEERSSRQKIIKGAALKEVFTTFFMWGFVTRPAAAADRGQFRQLGICPHSEGRSKNGKFSIWMGCWLGWPGLGRRVPTFVWGGHWIAGYRHGGNLPRKKSLKHQGFSYPWPLPLPSTLLCLC